MTAPARRTTPASAGVFIGGLLLACLLCGCATPQSDALLKARPTDLALARSMRLLDFAQKDHECGPAALAMALQASGDRVTPQALAGSLVVPALKGSLAPEMLATARRRGRLAVVLDPELGAIFREVADGTPVVVLQNLGIGPFPRWHYAVVAGYDLLDRTVLLQSGGQSAAPLDLRVFERTWARSGRWAMVAVAPERLAGTVGPDRLFEAAAALERVDPAAAMQTYRAMTKRFPALPYPWIGLGNASLAMGSVDESIAAFRAATAIDPGSGDAWNNLATALADGGRRCEALGAALRAVRLGGRHLPDYEATAAGLRWPACNAGALR